MGNSTGKPDVDISLGLNLSELKKQAAAAKRMLQRAVPGSIRAADLKGYEQVQNRIERINKAVGPVRKQFAGWALSIMFFGMALTRAFNTIWKTSTKTFQDIMHSVEGTVTSFDIMQGSIAYLGFVAGQALEPIAAMLVPWIDKIADVISGNESLFRKMVIGLGVGGTVLTVIGMGVLAWNGMAEAISIVTNLVKTLNKMEIMNNLITQWKWIRANPLSAGLVFGLITGIILVLVYINKLQNAMGGWGEFFKSVGRGILRVIIMIGAGMAWVMGKVVQGIVWALNKIIDALNRVLMSELVQWGADKIGLDVSRVNKIQYEAPQFGNMMEDYFEWEKQSALAPDQGYATGLAAIPQYEVKVQIDGEEVASKVTDIIVSEANAS